MINFENVSVEKGGTTILRGISLRIAERRVGIVGKNGSGKSTFARLFNGIEKPTSGSVYLEGEAKSQDLRKSVGFVFQNPDNQIVYPIVGEDLAFGLKNKKLPDDQIDRKIQSALERFNLGHLRERFTHQLSGGEKQMIALIGVLVMQPRLIVFDEPTTLLDLWNKRRFMSAIDELDENLVIVSHDLPLLEKFDRIIHIDAGEVVNDGDPQSVIDGYVRQSQC
ncbi:energy-coupling factor ABC transporter ATP-binding protein [Sedimentitalea nanhaiensis]|nr:ABC transporter ATP-binding protein [Sedimentitalea nanhaiensis]